MEVNIDLQKERKSATFETEKLTEILYNGKTMVRRRRYLQNIIFQDKYINSFTPWWNRERDESYDTAVKKSVYINKLLRDLNITNGVEQFYIREAAACQESNPLGLHQVMFIPTIEKQGTKEQIAKYVEPAKQYKILGTYAQTELGHGTFIRGLETTATYDPNTEEFIINSPTLSSMKYWPGSMGKTCNYVILMAQLYSQGKRHGIHAFVVQIRSLKDHTPLPGISVGDIGNKLGYGGMDNGYLMFNNYRVPRDSMLMRYAKVEKDGSYVRTSSPKVTYGTMVYVRSTIVGKAATALSYVVTIATRYSAVRRQTEIKPGGEEPQVIDYQTQQEKIFPLLSAAYAFLFTGNMMVQEYTRINADMEKGRFDEMQVLHALAAGLKAFSSDTASNGIDKLRMACGGHGYSHASGIPKIWANITPACTYEGENTVMYLQCARYLVKQYAQAATGQKLVGFMSYLNNPVKQRSALNDALSMSDLIEAYEHTAARLIKVAATRMQSMMKGGMSVEEARNKCAVPMVYAAKAHCQAYVVKMFNTVANRPSLDTSVARVLQTLCKLYAVYGINQRLGEFIQDGFLDGQQADMILNKTLSLFAEIRPNAVALVDAFDYPDEILQSCIGRYDGRVYEALYEYAKTSPLNKQDVHDSYYTTLKPLMKGELKFDTPTARL
ncbi:peroxisomal acyl-coenzyme A oxidase 1-like isoform X2 [Mercenaria mercenaria]|uniref:peroxisomal acyl-coenzyme A oxidase 1-like isoform X2 n=1 Tax=Mercenaria mercenaria TaxID=6596 RepID=UPI00234E9542|nr:peroxisomal acyl-coenzyme A oxidase 1-like isoform X2 [Mercenaria mercenaria]